MSVIAADEQAVWVEVPRTVRIDPQTNEVVATISLDSLTGYDAEIVIGAGSVWVAGVNYSENAERDVAERGARGGLVMTEFRR